MSVGRLRAHPRFFAVLATIVLIAVGEGWCWRERSEAGRRMEEKLARLTDEEKTLTAAIAADSDAAANLGDARAELGALHLRIANNLEHGEVPRQRAEAYFDLAAFTERMRVAAAQHEVGLAPDERFGFAEYASKGPAPALIEAVFHDRQRVEYLLRTLFASRPSRLVNVQRERMEIEGVEQERATGEAFEFASSRSVRVPGSVAGRAFKLTFIAGTATVRTLLDRFMESDQPIVVRSVEAARIDGVEVTRPALAKDEEPVLLVAGVESRFTVMVEWLAAEGPLPFTAEVGRISRAEGERSPWRAPEPQSRGPGWIYELFTPPDIYRDSRTREFSVAVPTESSPTKAEVVNAVATPTFPLELVEVKRALFRLQLIGFVGDETKGCGLFENAATTEVFVVRGKYRRSELDLTIEEFAVRRSPVRLTESMTTQRLVAHARVRDERTGAVVELNSLERRHTNEAVAVVALRDAPQIRTVREGDAIEADGAVYRIRKIQLHPPALQVSRESRDGVNDEQRTLTAREEKHGASVPAS